MDVAQYDVASTKSGKTAASIKALSLTLSSTSVVKHYMDVDKVHHQLVLFIQYIVLE